MLGLYDALLTAKSLPAIEASALAIFESAEVVQRSHQYVLEEREPVVNGCEIGKNGYLLKNPNTLKRYSAPKPRNSTTSRNPNGITVGLPLGTMMIYFSHQTPIKIRLATIENANGVRFKSRLSKVIKGITKHSANVT